MQNDWNELNIGGKVIASATAIAVLSMFMTWVDVGIVSQSGFGQQAFIFLGLYVYPALMVWKKKKMAKLWGLISSISAILITFSYINSKSLSLFGNEVNGAGSGAYVFLLASIALVVGVLKYEASDNNIEAISRE